MTQLEQRCLAMISAFITENGYSPSYQEIADALGSRKSRVCAVVGRLIDLRQLARDGGKRRNLRFPWVDLTHVPTEQLVAEIRRRDA